MATVSPKTRAWPRRAGYAGLACLAALFVVTGAAGQSWLRHWDEDTLVDKVRWSVDHSGTLLPGVYDWPSVSYDLALVAFVPEVVSVARAAGRDAPALSLGLMAAVDRPAYRLRMRRLFLLVTALAIPWVAAAVHAAGYSPVVAFGAAALLATSWTVAYHARWATPDGPMMQFTALAVAAIAAAGAARRPAFSTVAALAAGAAVACKYSVWPLVVMVMASAAAALPDSPWWRPAGRAAVLAAAGFLVLTPGAFLQPYVFVASLISQWGHYQTGHFAHTIPVGWPHLAISVEALTAHGWSRWPVASVALSVLWIPGAIHMWRHQRALAITVIGFPLVFLAWMALQRVFIVRNLLPLFPCLAITMAVGGSVCWHWRPHRAIRAALVLTALIVLIDNTAWLVRAADSRRAPARESLLRTVAQEMGGNAACATPGLAAAFARHGLTPPPAIAPACAGAARVYFLRSEMASFPPPGSLWFERIHGPLEVDYTAYPDWIGYDPVVVATPTQAALVGVLPTGR